MMANKLINQISAVELGDYILYKYGIMSHAKLQKLLYYCDAYHFAYLDEVLLYEVFEAWNCGPVCKVIFDEIKSESLYCDLTYGKNNDCDLSTLTTKQIEIITEVLDYFIGWTDGELESTIKKEQPWIDARKGFSYNDQNGDVINKVTMRDFYKIELNPQPPRRA